MPLTTLFSSGVADQSGFSAPCCSRAGFTDGARCAGWGFCASALSVELMASAEARTTIDLMLITIFSCCRKLLNKSDRAREAVLTDHDVGLHHADCCSRRRQPEGEQC